MNEVRCSEARPEAFQLYRVFNFGPGARLYMLPGAISGSCHLDATQYRAFVQHRGCRASDPPQSAPLYRSLKSPWMIEPPTTVFLAVRVRFRSSSVSPVLERFRLDAQTIT